MDIIVPHFAEVEKVRRSSNVAFLIPIPFYLPIMAGHQHKSANVELPVVIQKWVCNIQLKDNSLCIFTVPPTAVTL